MNKAFASFILAICSFASGAAMMIIELTGIRLLAPVFGNSLFTWTALIGVVLVCVSLGGLIGGKLADKYADYKTLTRLLLASALSAVLIPLINPLLVDQAVTFGMIYGPTFLSLVLFAIPGVLLGAIGPLITRLMSMVHDDKRIGSAAGLANMSSAIGSFIGTFSAGFLLIPNIDVRYIFALTAATLLLLAFIVRYASPSKLKAKETIGYTIACTYIFAIVSITSKIDQPNVVQSTNSAYQQVFIYDKLNDDNDTVRMLSTGHQIQGGMNLRTGESPLQYAEYFKLTDLYLDKIDTALFIGGGVYSVPKLVARKNPDAKINVIEIDGDVTKAVEKHFGLSAYPSISTINQEARWFINQDDLQYDYIFVDAFHGLRSIPAHLTTVEFFTSLKKRLSKNGVVMMNIIGNNTGYGSETFNAIAMTVSSVYKDIDIYQTKGKDDRLSNMIIYASDDLKNVPTTTEDDIINNLLATNLDKKDYSSLNLVPLTDNLNPIESIIAKMVINE